MRKQNWRPTRTFTAYVIWSANRQAVLDSFIVHEWIPYIYKSTGDVIIKSRTVFSSYARGCRAKTNVVIYICGSGWSRAILLFGVQSLDATTASICVVVLCQVSLMGRSNPHLLLMHANLAKGLPPQVNMLQMDLFMDPYTINIGRVSMTATDPCVAV